MSSNLLGLQNKEERVQIVPSFPACSKWNENCINTGCCQVSGHTCFSKGEGKAWCNETCTPGVKGFTCDVISPHSVPVAAPLGQNLYCFAVYTENTGNESLVNHELELLNIVAARGAGLFACEQWDVFSDVSAPLVNGYVTIKVEDTFGEFHQLKRKDSGTWGNWGMFYQVWVKIREVGKWQTADYTVKIDADAVFVPQRLRTWLSSKPGESPHGLYYENCPNVQYGFFGHLEIISKTAVKELMNVVDESIPTPERDLDVPFLMPIDHVHNIQGRGCVITGRMERGKLKTGQDVEVIGYGKSAKGKVTGIEMFHKILEEANAGDQMGLLARGIKSQDVTRGT